MSIPQDIRLQVSPEYTMTDDQERYIPSDKEIVVVGETFRRFRRCADDRNRRFQYFDGATLIEYIDDSVKRFNTNYDDREDIEDWQARINDPFTRTKVTAVLGTINSVLPMAAFTGRGDEDARKGTLLTSLYEFAEDQDSYDELMQHILLEAIVKGTVIGYEGVEKHTRVVRDIQGVGDEITINEYKEITTKLPGAIVPLEEFYPSSVGIRTIDKMPYCFRRYVMPYSEFMDIWRPFIKAKYVKPMRRHANEDQKPYYLDYVSNEVQEGSVEIIQFYDRDHDQYIITANGVWINPIVNEEISPLPFSHKKLPFWQIKFDIFGDFFYGKSLPDRLKSMQDVLNVLTNMLLDQSFLTIFPPLLTNGYDSIEEDYLRPGRRTPIDTQGLPINEAFVKLDLGAPSGWHEFILNYTRNIMEESAGTSLASGAASSGGRITAQEIQYISKTIADVMSIFARNVNYGVKQKAMLKASNILQFWTDKQSPMVVKILGDGTVDEFNKVFNTFSVDNTVLTGGKRGTKLIEVYSDAAEMPTKKELQGRAIVATANSGKNIEIVALPGEYLREFLYDVKLVSNPKKEMSKDIEQSLQLEKVRVYMSFFPNQVNVDELAAETAEIMGDDPTKILMPSVFQKQQQSPNPMDQSGQQPNQQNPEAASQMNPYPQQNTANNLTRQNAPPPKNLVQLKAALTGL